MMSLLKSDVDSLDLLNEHQQRLYRIVEESLDVAFILCNSELEEFTLAKIFDIFDQILPTAFILNTAFWPFFNSIKGQCLCVCGRYGLPCRHQKSMYHWIDLQPLEIEDSTDKFYPKYNGPLQPLEYRIQINQVKDETIGYNIVIFLKLQHKRIDRGRPKKQDKGRKREDSQTDRLDIFVRELNARYYISKQFYDGFYTIIFHPNPFFHEHYGSYFTNLLNQRSSYQWETSTLSDIRRYFTVPNAQVPNFSLILAGVNVPIYQETSEMQAIYPMVQPLKIKYKRMRRHKHTQTSILDFIDNNPRVRRNYFDKTYQPIAESIRKIEQSFFDDAGIDESMQVNIPEYFQNQSTTEFELKNVQANIKSEQNIDNQCSLSQLNGFCNNEFKVPKTSMKFYAPSYGRHIHSAKFVNDLNASTSIKDEPFSRDCMYSNIPSQTNYGNINGSVPFDLNFNCFSAIKNEIPEPSFSNISYADVLKKQILTKKEIDEQFEIIEEVIKEDLVISCRSSPNSCWWNGLRPDNNK